jgi:hypothetical protein
MKDLILNFSWDKLFSLPPTEFLSLFVLFALAIWISLACAGLVVKAFFD